MKFWEKQWEKNRKLKKKKKSLSILGSWHIVKKKKLHFIPLNYTSFYIYPSKLSECTFIPPKLLTA